MLRCEGCRGFVTWETLPEIGGHGFTVKALVAKARDLVFYADIKRQPEGISRVVYCSPFGLDERRDGHDCILCLLKLWESVARKPG